MSHEQWIRMEVAELLVELLDWTWHPGCLWCSAPHQNYSEEGNSFSGSNGAGIRLSCLPSLYGSVSHESFVPQHTQSCMPPGPNCISLSEYGALHYAACLWFETLADNVAIVKQNTTFNSNHFICFRERIWHQKERNVCLATLAVKLLKWYSH